MYILDRFGTIIFPHNNPETDISPIGARSAIVQTVAGVFDAYGDGMAALALPHPIDYQTMLLEDSLAELRDTVDAWRAAVRTRAKLYRRAEDDDAIQWCYARLMSMPSVRRTDDKQWLMARFQFQQITPWVGHDHTSWTLDDGSLLDDGLYFDEPGLDFALTAGAATNCVVTNGGNRAVTDAVLTITAGSANITIMTVTTANGSNFTYTATLVAGDVLVIDGGAQSVTNDGAADYDNFALNGGHSLEDWLRLEPGNTTLAVTLTGGGTGSTLSVELRDGWA